MTIALEALQEAVVAGLHTLDRDNLVGICDFLNISGAHRTNIKHKSRISLVTHILKHLEREEVAELEDNGMSELLLLQDKVSEIVSSTASKVHVEPHAKGGAAQERMEGPTVVSQQNQVGTEQMTVTASADDSLYRPHTTASSQVQAQSSSSAQSQQSSPYWRKDFKISGQVGEPGQKDKLRFSSLAHQIENGLSQGYPDMEIVDAVIRAVSPGLQLCSYLEGKPYLTLPTLRCILHSHFQEKSATDLYKQLESEAQHSKETPQSFLVRVLDLRQKVLFASQESE